MTIDYKPLRYEWHNIQRHYVEDVRVEHWEQMRMSETSLYELTDSKELENCREHYCDGIGTRSFPKMVEKNFGMDDTDTVVAYSTDKHGKVMRVWENRYDDPKGDSVGESVCWPPKIREVSTRWLTKKPYKHCQVG